VKSVNNNSLAGNRKQPSPVTSHIDFGWLKCVTSYFKYIRRIYLRSL